ncbi:MAG: VWA domain-containing protein [Acholeplasmatales bacterium]|nr:VWA domain-containing protein [Acholeplasmatales bacterium]
MSNINFDNPFLLLIGIPLLLIVIIPFIISVKRDNINKHNVTSFIFHIIICLLITLVFAKTTYEMVMTETNIYVLADVSYSSNNNLDLIDDHIETIKDDMPKNSKLGVICFGKDYEITTELGDSFKTVKDNNVDNSETNIVSALEYASSLFEEDVIKRIVIITDGKETNESNTVSLIEGMIADNIYVDAIYLDNNINENINEVQINSIEFTNDVFLNSK